ncbi:MAG: acyltransferase [Clostridia bacterium]|nr:acyltransferase [Clostridia bacterium]
MMDSSTKDKKYISYFDNLKAVAAFAVVILHVFFGADSFAVTAGQHIYCLLMRNLMMWSVPCFVMVTGALLLDPTKDTDVKKVLKYCLRVIAALVVFSIIFSMFDSAVMYYFSGEKQSIKSVFKDIVCDIFMGTGWKHMWYLYLMLAIYLTLPIFRAIILNSSQELIKYFVIIGFIFLSVVPTINTIFKIELPFYIFLYSIYPLFLILGYAIHNDIIKFNFIASVLLCVAGIVGITGITIYGIIHASDMCLSLTGTYTFPCIIFLAVGVFSLFKRFCNKKSKFLCVVSKCSFGIYLMHFAIVKYFAVVIKPNVFAVSGAPLLYVEAVIATLVPIVITLVYRKIHFRKG